MRQSDGEAVGERRACVRAEDGDNKLSPPTDTNTALSGSDYLRQRPRMCLAPINSRAAFAQGATVKCSNDHALPE